MSHRRSSVCAALAIVALSATVHAQVGARQDAPPAMTLDQALQYAIDHYPTVRAVLEQVNVSTATVSVARAAYLPRLDSLWQTNRATANNVVGQLLPQSVLPSISGPAAPSVTSQSAWGTAAGALFSWEPLDLGLRAAAVREAEAGVVRAEADQALTRLQVQHAVGAAYLAVAGAEQALVAAEADVERRSILARAAHTLVEHQLRPGAEASRADAERAAAHTRAILTRQSLLIAQATLAQMLGVSGQVSVNAASLLDRVVEARAPIAAPAEHPLAESGRAAVELAKAREAVLASTDRPRLFVQSSVFARGTGLTPDGRFQGGSDGLGLERANWAAGVTVVFPNLFTFASLRARQAASAAATRAESARYDEAVLTVTSQQQVASAMVDAARAVAQNTPIQLAAARQSEAQARARYEAGLASIVEVAETQGLLAAAEYQNALARVDVWRALFAQSVAQGNIASFVELVRGSGVP